MLVKIAFSGSKNGKIASARPNHGGPRLAGALRAPRRLWRRLPPAPSLKKQALCKLCLGSPPSLCSQPLDTTLCDPMHVRPDPSTPDCDASRLTLSRCPVSSTQHNTIFIQTWLCTGSSAVFRYVSYTVHGTTAHAHSISWCWDDLTYRYTHRTELPAACCLLHATC